MTMGSDYTPLECLWEARRGKSCKSAGALIQFCPGWSNNRVLGINRIFETFRGPFPMNGLVFKIPYPPNGSSCRTSIGSGIH